MRKNYYHKEEESYTIPVHGEDFKSCNIQDANEGSSLAFGAIK